MPPSKQDLNLQQASEKAIIEAMKEHSDFISCFSNKQCYLCLQPLNTFSESEPCLHWLLRRTNRIKKRNIEYLLKNVDMLQALSYVRWVANTESKGMGINDLSDEIDEDRYYECTVTWKNISWSFLVENLQGHTQQENIFPHYHLHMTINNKPFIVFSNFHIPLQESDIFFLRLRVEGHERMKHVFLGGESYEDWLRMVNHKDALANMKSGDKDTDSPFHLQTMITAKEGSTISGDEIASLVKESNRTGETMAALVRDRLKNVKVKTIISPSEGIVDQVKRKRRKQ